MCAWDLLSNTRAVYAGPGWPANWMRACVASRWAVLNFLQRLHWCLWLLCGQSKVGEQILQLDFFFQCGHLTGGVHILHLILSVKCSQQFCGLQVAHCDLLRR